MFGDMLDLTTTLSTSTTSTICSRLLGYIIPNVDNRLHTFASPPRTRKQLYLDVNIHQPLLMTTRQAASNPGGSGTYNYYGYIDTLPHHAYLGDLVH